MTEQWRGEPGKPGEVGEDAEHGGLGGRGGAGGRGGDAGESPFAEQLTFVRREEEKMHRQRRITNWVVVGAVVATLGAVVGYGQSQNGRADDQRRQLVTSTNSIVKAQETTIAALESELRTVVQQRAAVQEQILLYAEATCRATPGCVAPPTPTTVPSSTG